MTIKKDDLKISKKNKIIDILYKGECIFRSDKIEKINFDEILGAINEIENKYHEKNIKFRKFLIILSLGGKNKSYKQNYLLDRIVLEDKECLDFIGNFNKKSLDSFLTVAAVNDVKYKQYKGQRLLKKWLLFLILSTILFLLNINGFRIFILFMLFLLTEPIFLVRILAIIGKIQENL